MWKNYKDEECAALISNKTKVRIEKMSRLHPYAGVWNYFSMKILGLRPYTGVWNYFSMKILGLRPYLHDFLTKDEALTSS